MSTPRNENLSGKPNLGRYTILREVARSNDIVYEAVDPTINRRIAIKELNIAPTLTGQARRERIERFFREGRAAGAMNHPNIVTIFEIGEDNGRFFIAMEFLEGQSLRDRLQTVGPFSLSEAVATTAALCDALAFAHDRGVVHRDIKPDNVHILPGGQVKLTDFGIARILGEDSLTMAGQVFGTPSYMSPEQVTGNPLDGRTDQFSLGVLLYEMLTGRKPFTGDTVVTITYRIIHEPMPVPAGVPPEVAQVMERAMGKAPESRFASVTDFKNALIAAAERGRTGNFATAYPAPNNSPVGIGIPASYYSDPLAPPVPAGITPTNSQPTIMYGAKTQASHFNPTTGGRTAGPVSPSQAPYQPTVPPSSRPRNNTATMAIAAVILIGVIGGTGFALRGAFSNIQASQSREQLVKTSNEGIALANKGEYEKAAALFKTVREAGLRADAKTRLNAATSETVCYRRLGQKAQTSGDLANAEMWFTRALEVSPLDINAKTELAGVQKMRGSAAGVSGGVSAPATTPSSPAVDDTNPLASLLKPTPNPVSSAPSGTSLPPAPSGVMPGAQTANDFTSANQKAAQDAQALLDKGDTAFNAHQMSDAVSYWREAVATGPGSPAAIKAQDRLTKFGSADDAGTP